MAMQRDEISVCVLLDIYRTCADMDDKLATAQCLSRTPVELAFVEWFGCLHRGTCSEKLQKSFNFKILV